MAANFIIEGRIWPQVVQRCFKVSTIIVV